MFGIGLQELFIILVIALLILGPDKLPDLARAIGKGIGEFRRATNELKDSINSDDELRELKNNLSRAKDEMTTMIREETKDIDVDAVSRSLAEGTFFKDGEENPEGAPPESVTTADAGESEEPVAVESEAGSLEESSAADDKIVKNLS